MSINVSIEVDKHTADVLQMRAAELGVTVPQLIAELATLDSAPQPDRHMVPTRESAAQHTA